MRRRRIPEEMDRRDLTASDHAYALRSLNQVNRLLGVDRRMSGCLSRFGIDRPSVLDLGCGGGGFLAHLCEHGWHGRAKPGRGLPSRSSLLLGLDRSEFALRCAARWHGRHGRVSLAAGLGDSTIEAARTHGAQRIHWLSADARRLPLADGSVDVVTCSLFLHHFDDDDIVLILCEAARVARYGVLIGDLVRSWPAWTLTWLATRLLSRSWIFHTDGPRSVRAAFRARELQALAHKAGLTAATVERHFPFRLSLMWNRSTQPVDPRL